MHYNLNERQKLKKHIPYRKILIVCALLLIAFAIYAFFFHSSGPAPAPAPT